MRFSAVATFTWSSCDAFAATIYRTPLAVRCVTKSSPSSLCASVKPLAVRSEVRADTAARTVTQPGPVAKPIGPGTPGVPGAAVLGRCMAAAPQA